MSKVDYPIVVHHGTPWRLNFLVLVEVHPNIVTLCESHKVAHPDEVSKLFFFVIFVYTLSILH